MNEIIEGTCWKGEGWHINQANEQEIKFPNTQFKH